MTERLLGVSIVGSKTSPAGQIVPAKRADGMPTISNEILNLQHVVRYRDMADYRVLTFVNYEVIVLEPLEYLIPPYMLEPVREAFLEQQKLYAKMAEEMAEAARVKAVQDGGKVSNKFNEGGPKYEDKFPVRRKKKAGRRRKT